MQTYNEKWKNPIIIVRWEILPHASFRITTHRNIKELWGWSKKNEKGWSRKISMSTWRFGGHFDQRISLFLEYTLFMLLLLPYCGILKTEFPEHSQGCGGRKETVTYKLWNILFSRCILCLFKLSHFKRAQTFRRQCEKWLLKCPTVLAALRWSHLFPDSLGWDFHLNFIFSQSYWIY